ncbi:chloroperoxidase [Legionella geestiana]|uniref:Chloroperoxidase n=2 Tax=Legionella geestiana TaxID=45065 RepID=A0A0W0U377_9GAMM|nr:alpha/beta hydrolase [Legionella geestiana]KTD02384.1 chloroperoxidase [Legionella geestiana]STX53130.1 chloroperoxidase [Legionella geestiana]
MNMFNHKNGYYLTAGEAQIYVEETGSPDGYPVIFLHGGLGSICDYSPFVGKIDTRFRCIGIDTRGHGMSTRGSEPLTYELLEKDTAEVLRQLNISRCAITGFSDGGIIAMRLGISKPQLISHLIGIGADWNPPDATLQALFSSLTIDSWKNKFPETIELYERLNPNPDFSNLMQAVIRMWLDLTPSGYPGKRVQALKCQTLIIRGDADPFLPLRHCAELHQEIPDAHFLNVPFAGHAAHITHAEAVGAFINQFLNRD